MPRKKIDHISPAEWKVMKIVWDLEECAIGEVLEKIPEEQVWSRSTVKTMLRRLVDKGFVNAKRVGNSFLYRPACSPVKSMIQAIDEIIDNALDGTSGPIVEHIIKKSDLSIEEIQKLQNLLDNYAKKKEKQK